MRFVVSICLAVAGGAALPHIRGAARGAALRWYGSRLQSPVRDRDHQSMVIKLVLLFVAVDIPAFLIGFAPCVLAAASLPRHQLQVVLGIFAVSALVLFPLTGGRYRA